MGWKFYVLWHSFMPCFLWNRGGWSGEGELYSILYKEAKGADGQGEGGVGEMRTTGGWVWKLIFRKARWSKERGWRVSISSDIHPRTVEAGWFKDKWKKIVDSLENGGIRATWWTYHRNSQIQSRYHIQWGREGGEGGCEREGPPIGFVNWSINIYLSFFHLD